MQGLHLPITPLHYPIAKIIYKLKGKASLSLPALTVGSMVPDLEVVYLWSGTWTQDRMILHSFIGGLTLGTLITVALTVFVYPWVLRSILPIHKDRVKKKCAFSFMLVFSGLAGVLFHVILDVTNHTHNPLFWPFISLSQTPSPIVPLLWGQGMASLIVNVALIVTFITLVVKNRSNVWEQLLVG